MNFDAVRLRDCCRCGRKCFPELTKQADSRGQYSAQGGRASQRFHDISLHQRQHQDLILFLTTFSMLSLPRNTFATAPWRRRIPPILGSPLQCPLSAQKIYLSFKKNYFSDRLLWIRCLLLLSAQCSGSQGEQGDFEQRAEWDVASG